MSQKSKGIPDDPRFREWVAGNSARARAGQALHTNNKPNQPPKKEQSAMSQFEIDLLGAVLQAMVADQGRKIAALELMVNQRLHPTGAAPAAGQGCEHMDIISHFQANRGYEPQFQTGQTPPPAEPHTYPSVVKAIQNQAGGDDQVARPQSLIEAIQAKARRGK